MLYFHVLITFFFYIIHYLILYGSVFQDEKKKSWVIVFKHTHCCVTKRTIIIPIGFANAWS